MNPVVAESPNVGRRDFPTPCDPHHALGENGPARYATLCSEMNATARSEFPCAGAVESEAVEAAQDRFTRFPREPRQGSPGVRNGTQSSPNGNQFVGAEPCYQNRVQQSALRASPSELSVSQRTTMAKADIACRILLAGGLFLWTMPGTSQDRHLDIPLHAHMAAGRQGWICNRAFRQVGRLCVSDRYGFSTRRAFETFNSGWRCVRGYRRLRGYCVPLSIPRHALPVGNGGEWRCDSGYRREESRCEAVFVPPHAHLDSSGHSWQCDAGFRVLSEVCIPSSSPDSIS